jgi:hypothetical protein
MGGERACQVGWPRSVRLRANTVWCACSQCDRLGPVQEPPRARTTLHTHPQPSPRPTCRVKLKVKPHVTQLKIAPGASAYRADARCNGHNWHRGRTASPTAALCEEAARTSHFKEPARSRRPFVARQAGRVRSCGHHSARFASPSARPGLWPAQRGPQVVQPRPRVGKRRSLTPDGAHGVLTCGAEPPPRPAAWRRRR